MPLILFDISMTCLNFEGLNTAKFGPIAAKLLLALPATVATPQTHAIG